MVSVANCGFVASSASKLFSTSLRTYSAKIMVTSPRRPWIKTARETLQGAYNPSSTTPESKKSLGTALLLSIQLLKETAADSRKVLQGLFEGDTFSFQVLLDALTKAIKGRINRNHHQSCAELEQQDLTPFRQFMFLT